MEEKKPKNSLLGLSTGRLNQLVERMRGRPTESLEEPDLLTPAARAVPERLYRFDQMEAHVELVRATYLIEKVGIQNPYFKCHQGIPRSTTRIEGRDLVNFATYNYLDLNGHPEVSQAAKEAIDRYGTSASASRITSGDKEIHRELERAVADFLGTEACHIFVSGHATNVTTIGQLMGPKDLIVHDALVHNSVSQGALLSGAHRLSFPHNDVAALDRLLSEVRGNFERVLVCVEGLYSMDGDLPPLPELIELRRRHGFFLMVDEAHSIGTVGDTGRGVGEHFQVDPADVDIWMGTFSKSLAGCGGFIAGSRSLIYLLEYTAPGSVYSVGMAPPVAAAALAAIGVLRREPERVRTLRARTRYLMEQATERGLDIGRAQGFAIVPVIVGSSTRAARLTNRLFDRGVNVVPIVAPAVEERAARLRFFLSCAHDEEQIRDAVATVVECLPLF